MNVALLQTNRDLLHQVSALRETMRQTEIPMLLDGYRNSVDRICAQIEANVARNLVLLEKEIEAVQPDLLHATAGCSILFDLVNSRLASALIRVHQRDELALSVIAWLHAGHELTRDKAFAVSSGQFAVYPHKDWPVVYYLPTSSQMALRYLPLVFHEFGHLLYALCKPELDDLIKEFQTPLKRALAPRAIRDGQPNNDTTRSQVLVAWHDFWTQEVFCDAIGLTIGGPGFLYAFSHYFRFRSSEEYFLQREEQLLRRHPVTALRIQLLLERAERFGLGQHANAVQRDWRRAATLFGVSTDYQGTWDDRLSEPLHDILDDMIEEASPFDYRDADDSCPQRRIDADWERFNAAKGPDYLALERESVSGWLDSVKQ